MKKITLILFSTLLIFTGCSKSSGKTNFTEILTDEGKAALQSIRSIPINLRVNNLDNLNGCNDEKDPISYGESIYCKDRQYTQVTSDTEKNEIFSKISSDFNLSFSESSTRVVRNVIYNTDNNTIGEVFGAKSSSNGTSKSWNLFSFNEGIDEWIAESKEVNNNITEESQFMWTKKQTKFFYTNKTNKSETLNNRYISGFIYFDDKGITKKLVCDQFLVLKNQTVATFNFKYENTEQIIGKLKATTSTNADDRTTTTFEVFVLNSNGEFESL